MLSILVMFPCFPARISDMRNRFSALSTESSFIGFIQDGKFLRQSELKIEVICEVIVNKTCEQ